MRVVALACVLVSLSVLPTEAKFVPGTSFTATLESDTTGATATMTWTTDSSCTQGPVTADGRPQFRCDGRWRCHGDACPGNRGRLEFNFDPEGYHSVLLRIAPRTICTAHYVGVPQGPQSPPYHWTYQCFTRHPPAQTDSGTAVVALQVPE